MKVIINAQHDLLPEQIDLLNSKFNNWRFYTVPPNGWNKEQIHEEIVKLKDEGVVFVSPVPLLLAQLSAYYGGFMHHAEMVGSGYSKIPSIWLFHNDRREKKELPNGKVISVAAKEGWELIKIRY